MARDADGRVDPDELLRAVERRDARDHRGKLKVFFGYAAGVGKTYAMLQAAHAARRRGVDVVIGYIEPHARPQTAALVRGLERIAVRTVASGEMSLREFDLDAVLARRPGLVLVDELAHSNAPGSRHEKRYQDVEELLCAGIDVYTTVNVQHLESLNDVVASITGVTVRERVPDRIVDEADQVELVDIEPQDLIERLRAGEVYAGEQAGRALENFFTADNLAALREVALRCCADRANRLNEEVHARDGGVRRAVEHVLACLSPSPSNPRIVRAAARMAAAFHATFTALHVEAPDERLDDEDRARLQRNIRLAEQLGARIETAHGADVAFQIAEYARLLGVSKVVIGRSASRRHPFGPAPLTERLVSLAPSLDVYIIPDGAEREGARAARRAFSGGMGGFNARDTLRTASVLLACVAIGFAFDALGFLDANIIAVFLLGTVVTAMVTTSRFYAPLSSLLAVGLFNFCFVSPRFSLGTFSQAYMVTYAVMFAVSLLASTLATRLTHQARQSARTAFRTKVLLDTNRLVQHAADEVQIRGVVAAQLAKLLDRDIVFYPVENAELGEAEFTASCDGGPVRDECLTPHERAVAAWTLKNSRRAGATTATLPDARCLYLPVRVGDEVYGVVGIVLEGGSLDAFESSLSMAIVGECGLALEGERAAREREEAAVRAKNEHLRADLLRSIGHDLRTPLTAIAGSADILLGAAELSDGRRRALLEGIAADARWLTETVENLLAVTRLEEGAAPRLALSCELLQDVVDEAVAHAAPHAGGHGLAVDSSPEPLVVRMDARLVVQAIVNLVDNAFKYAPDGTEVSVRTYRERANAVVEVADRGPGIPEEDKAHVCEMFYTVTGRSPVDGQRSLGLGLALCRSIALAHGGSIEVGDTVPHGARMRLVLPVEEVSLT